MRLFSDAASENMCLNEFLTTSKLWIYSDKGVKNVNKTCRITSVVIRLASAHESFALVFKGFTGARPEETDGKDEVSMMVTLVRLTMWLSAVARVSSNPDVTFRRWVGVGADMANQVGVLSSAFGM